MCLKYHKIKLSFLRIIIRKMKETKEKKQKEKKRKREKDKKKK
jgi:hypothetical protein